MLFTGRFLIAAEFMHTNILNFLFMIIFSGFYSFLPD